MKISFFLTKFTSHHIPGEASVVLSPHLNTRVPTKGLPLVVLAELMVKSLCWKSFQKLFSDYKALRDVGNTIDFGMLSRKSVF